MRDKILQVLREAGHGLIISKIYQLANDQEPWLIAELLKKMEIDKLIICHRSSGSAGIPKGEIVLITLRPDGH